MSGTETDTDINTTTVTDDSDRILDHHTHHWLGIGAVALVIGGIGVLAQEPGLILASIVCVVFAGYAGTAQPLRLHDDAGEPVLTVTRRLEDTAPDPGDDVVVTVEVRNSSESFLPDVRIVDGVPSELEVTDGTPRHGAVLGPGKGSLFEYTVTATRGDHDWQPASVTVTDPSGSIERETTIDTDTTFHCTLSTAGGDQLPLGALTTQYAGRIETDSGGSGVEFYATREYRPSDPLSRVDWYRRAKTGDLGTLEFREERTARVLFVIDTRRSAYRAPGPGGSHAVERSVDAANHLFDALLDSGDQVGITTFGSRESCWLSPGAGQDHRARGRVLLSSHPSLSPIPPAESLFEGFRADRRAELKRRRIERIHRRISPDTQVFLFSPCCDEFAPTIARRLDAYGHEVTVISPDPTTDETPLAELAQMERTDRLTELRRTELRVFDWQADESITEALARAKLRWSR